MGPARGKAPTSYRAEGYGMLSVLRFLRRIREYCRITQDWEWTIVSDNESLVDSINIEHLDAHDWVQWTTPESIEANAIHELLHSNSLNHTLKPDWDLINEIRWNYDQMRTRGKIQHEKGHQDDHTPYASLNLLAQLNCDADTLASVYQDTHAESRERVYLLPHAGAQLHLNKATITSNLAMHLRQAETGPPLENYLKERNSWSAATFKSIDWNSHASFLKKHHTQRIHLCKHLHEVLPINANVHRHAPTTQQMCPLCGMGPEDRDYVFQCEHPTRHQWRDQFVHDFRAHCKARNTRPGMTSIIIDGIIAWMKTETHRSLSSSYVIEYHTAIEEQNRIGWRHIFHGRWSLRWSFLQGQGDYLA